MTNKSNELSDVSDEVFAKVARELATGKPDEALWTKAFALQNGNESATKAHYIRLRAEQIQRNADGKIEAEANPAADDAPHIAGPWARYFARYLDLALGVCLALFLVILLLAGIQPANVQMTGPGLVISLLIICLIPLLPWVIDALMVAMFGNGLGKAIWGIKVRHKDGRPLTFKETLNRNFLVCLHGFWTGITPLTFLPHIFNYNRLKKGEETKWDAKGNYDVLSSNPGAFRKVVGITLLVFVLLILGTMEFGAKIVARKTFDTTTAKPVESTPQPSHEAETGIQSKKLPLSGTYTDIFENSIVGTWNCRNPQTGAIWTATFSENHKYVLAFNPRSDWDKVGEWKILDYDLLIIDFGDLQSQDKISWQKSGNEIYLKSVLASDSISVRCEKVINQPKGSDSFN